MGAEAFLVCETIQAAVNMLEFVEIGLVASGYCESAAIWNGRRFSLWSTWRGSRQ